MQQALFNIASYLPQRAREAPGRAAVICEHSPDALGRTRLSFQELNADSDVIASGLSRSGLKAGERTLVMVRPGLDFISITFALFKLGAVPVLIDPGMGKKNLLDCIRQVRPQALIGISLAHALRVLSRSDAFNDVKLNVTVGRRWFWGGETLSNLRQLGAAETRPFPLAETSIDTPAAILFTTGSTGIPKGVLYRHGMFLAQVSAIREQYGIEPGEIDLPAFPLFALFSTALGTTCVIPDMDPTRPAQCDPAKIVGAIQKHNVTYTFGSPSIWKRVGPYCIENKIKLPTLKRILMAGAPVRGEVLAPFKEILPPGSDTHIPYGATESLPVSSMRGSEVLAETWELTRQGKGHCIGRPLPGVTVKIIRADESRTAELPGLGSVEVWDDSRVLPDGEIGEICVKGPVVTREYFEMPEQTCKAKIYERRIPLPSGERAHMSEANEGVRGNASPAEHAQPLTPDSLRSLGPLPGGEREYDVWHRIGDMGYFDDKGRLWFCGRKAHRVLLEDGKVLYSVCVEAIVESMIERECNQPIRVALAGIGPAEEQAAVVIAEAPKSSTLTTLIDAFDDVERNAVKWCGADLARQLRTLLFYPAPFPVDIRHNAKINREELARWAEKELARRNQELRAKSQ
ncbi:MAG TPA: fatty acid CoA ligase family protein [Planctomycetota bacterium]|nr:fatty acid CoA ligase family protein [Planctomycetota bacterium]